MRRPIVKRDYDRSTKKDCSWFLVIEKHAALTEVRRLGDPHIDKTRCLQIIKKLLYLLNQGETFTKSEAAAILSSAVKLYRFQDVHLRRMFHLIARDLCPIAYEVPLVTSSLLEDVNTGNAAYRATAIRSLRLITNDTSLSQVVKFLAKTLCDDNPMVQIASHVCAINLVKGHRRMAITLDRAYPSKTAFTDGRHIHFHAMFLGLVMGPLRCRDCIYWKTEIRYSSPSSTSLLESYILTRGIWQAARRGWPVRPGNGNYKHIMSCIRNKDKMVALEGFRALEVVGGISDTELEDAVYVMRLNLLSHKTVLRFSAIRALQKVGLVHKVVYKLSMEEVHHRENEPQAEQVSQVIKSQSFPIKEDSKLINTTLGVGS